MDTTYVSWIPPNQVPVPVHDASETVPVVFNVDNRITSFETRTYETRTVETQTLPWDGILCMSIQEYLSRNLEPLLLGKVRGNMCIHKKGMTLDDVVAMIVERHNALCIRDLDESDKQGQIPCPTVESFTEAEAAAYVMTKLLSLQNEQAADPVSSNVGNYLVANSSASGSNSSRSPIKKPVESTMQELIERNVKIIRCDPPEHIIRKEAENRSNNSITGQRRHVSAKKWFQCSVCGLKLEDISKLSRHSAKHSKLRPYPCPKCNKKYKTRDQVGKHVREIHAKPVFKVFCPYCGKGFRNRYQRDDHVVTHTGKCPWICSHCSAAFKVKKSLTLHMKRKHDIGELLPCPLCDCKKGSSYTMSQHMTTLHKAQIPQEWKVAKGDSEICEYKCLICNQVMPDEPTLLQHMPTHKESACSTCVSLKRKKERLTKEAVYHGMDINEAEAKNVEALDKFVVEARAKKAAEKAAREALHVTKTAIARGLDEESAKDVTKATEFLKKLRKKHPVRQSSWNFKHEADNEEEQGVNVNNMNEMELRKSHIDIQKKEKELKKELENLKERLNRDAMVMALEIIEEIEAEEVLGKDNSIKEMAVVRAQLAARQKQGKPQKSLVTQSGKRAVGLQTDRERDVQATDISQAIESQEVDPVVRFHENSVFYDMRQSVKPSLDMQKLENKNVKKKKVEKKPSPNTPCTVYTESTAVTLDMLKKGEVTFCVEYSPGKTVATTAIHLKSSSSSHPSGFSSKIVIKTSTPEEVKFKLLAGELIMKLVPVTITDGMIRVVQQPSLDQSKRKSHKVIPEERREKRIVTRSMTGSAKPKQMGSTHVLPPSNIKSKQPAKVKRISVDKESPKSQKKDGSSDLIQSKRRAVIPLVRIPPGAKAQTTTSRKPSQKTERNKMIIVVPPEYQGYKLSKGKEMPRMQSKQNTTSSTLAEKKTRPMPPLAPISKPRTVTLAPISTPRTVTLAPNSKPRTVTSSKQPVKTETNKMAIVLPASSVSKVNTRTADNDMPSQESTKDVVKLDPDSKPDSSCQNVAEELSSLDSSGSSNSGSPQKKTLKRPAENTIEDLRLRNINYKRCDPPEHVLLKLEAENKNSSGKRKRIAKKWFKCSVCGLKLEDISRLTRHSAKHSTFRPYPCPKCQKSFKTTDDVRRHVRHIHTKQVFKVFCSCCKKGFRNRYIRDEHALTHTNKHPWKCSQCSKRFNAKKVLVLHLKRIHGIGELPKCPLCDCTDASLSYILNHMASMHKAQVPQIRKHISVYQCLICNLVFPEESELLSHMPTHGKPTCRTCVAKEKKQRLIAEAVNCGMDRDKAAAKGMKALEKWIKGNKEGNAGEKTPQQASPITTCTKAIGEGINEESA